MNPNGATYVLEARDARAMPLTLDLTSGVTLDPLSVGRNGTWMIEAPGVLLQHAFLYFDGETLYVQSTDVDAPVVVNGQPIPAQWTRIQPPCTLAVGAANLHYRRAVGNALADDDGEDEGPDTLPGDDPAARLPQLAAPDSERTKIEPAPSFIVEGARSAPANSGPILTPRGPAPVPAAGRAAPAPTPLAAPPAAGAHAPARAAPRAMAPIIAAHSAQDSKGSADAAPPPWPPPPPPAAAHPAAPAFSPGPQPFPPPFAPPPARPMHSSPPTLGSDLPRLSDFLPIDPAGPDDATTYAPIDTSIRASGSANIAGFASRPPPAMGAAPLPAPPAGGWWARAPLPRKVLVLLVPVAIAAALFALREQAAEAPAPAPAPALSTPKAVAPAPVKSGSGAPASTTTGAGAGADGGK